MLKVNSRPHIFFRFSLVGFRAYAKGKFHMRGVGLSMLGAEVSQTIAARASSACPEAQ